MSKRFGLIVLLALLVSSFGGAASYTPAHAAGVLYVKPGGSGDCSSWGNACTLQTAIDAAFGTGGGQIWVMKGIYKPHASDRAVSFTLRNGVAVYGGFNGTETDLSQRNPNPATNATILSGDIGTVNDQSDNSYHVVVGSNTNSTAILDGFSIILGGNTDTNLAWPAYVGGGMHIQGGSPKLANLIFANNTAAYGGGLHNHSNSSPTLTDITFSDNSASTDGGGMLNVNGSSPTLTNVTFSGNKATWGGGLYNNNASNSKLTNVKFLGNSVTAAGGGMYNQFSSKPALTNVTFSNNSAIDGGGMFNANGSNPTLINVTFSSNTATNGRGGGIYNGDSNSTLTNVTFSANSANISGGGMFNDSNSAPKLINTMIANSPNSSDCVGPLNSSSSNNLIESTGANACGLTNGVNGNITGVDPKLGPLANNGGPTQTHALLPGSPAIDAGKDSPDCPATDQRGIPRPRGLHCDIGAFESRNFTIKGNAGAAAAILKYNVAGIAKKATANAKGNYALTPIPEGWSGTVTPSHPCFTFTPAFKNYTNITANKTAQNYTTAFKAASTCAQITVKTGLTSRGTFVLRKNTTLERSYALNVGFLSANGSGNSVKFIASERVANDSTHFFELIGLPANLAKTSYAFPAYDNAAFASELRLANVGTADTSVTVTLRGTPVSGSPFALAPGASLRKSFAGNEGPLKVQSSGGVPIIASLRVIPRPANGSYSEIMGLPETQWSSSYHFPWYDNLNLNSQLRVANVGKSTTTVHVTVKGTVVDSFVLGRDKADRRSIPNLNDGPVKVSSSGGVPIVASLRVAFQTASTWTGFSEMMGLPESQLDSIYVFPGYTHNADLKMQLQVANPGASSATVHVFLAGKEIAGSPFPVAAGKSVFKTFPGINGGPMKVTANQNILASLSVRFPDSYSEWMGLPWHQLSNRYLFPWYINNTTFKTRLRLAVP